MGRKERRIQKKLEKNPIGELNKIQNRFYSQLFWKFSQTKDPRHPSYITYSNRMMLGTLYYKGIAGIDSMQEMTERIKKRFPRLPILLLADIFLPFKTVNIAFR